MASLSPYTPPEFQKTAFNCPHCGAYSRQTWAGFIRTEGGHLESLQSTKCEHCRGYTLWWKGTMLFPSGGIAPFPNADLPEDIRADYEEARAIASLSPRGAAALLRLSIQKMCKYLGEEGKNINDDIRSLVEKGLPVRVQKALDSVRVIGNDAVHPGEMDLRDNPETVNTLFHLVNFIAEKMISEPKEVDAMFEMLPENKRNQIAKRDEHS